jgi:hypothetical protein
MRQYFAGRRPSPAMAVAFAALLAALSGTAVALPGKNTVDSGDIKKNAVRSADIKNGAAGTKDIKNNDVRSGDVRNNTLTGADINESTLGQVPSAGSANTANSANSANSANNANTANSANRANSAGAVDGRIPFVLRLSAGESQTIAQNGAISLVADCSTDGIDDQARILAATSADGAILQGGEDDHRGPGSSDADTLDTTTPADDRELVFLSDDAGQVTFEDDIDSSYLVAPDGKVLTLGSETTPLGLNYSGAKCFFAGVVNSIG